MNLWEIEGHVHTAKGYKAVCQQELENLGQFSHHFEDDFKFYQDKISYYDDLITSLEQKRTKIFQRRMAGAVTVAHLVVIVAASFLWFYP